MSTGHWRRSLVFHSPPYCIIHHCKVALFNILKQFMVVCDLFMMQWIPEVLLDTRFLCIQVLNVSVEKLDEFVVGLVVEGCFESLRSVKSVNDCGKHNKLIS